MKRPWLAAGLTLFMTGLGHAYLRRWLRAFGWVALVVVTAMLFVPESAFTDPDASTFPDILPVVVLGGLCALDAYLLAKQHNTELAVQRAEKCPSCRRALDGDDDLSFCPWCAAGLQETDADK